MSDELQVRGGAGGSSARIADLHRCAAVAEQISERLGDASRQLGGLALGPEVIATAALSPLTATRAQAQAVQAAAQLTVSFGLLRARATQLRVTADAVEAVDRIGAFGTELGTTGRGLLALGEGITSTVSSAPSRFGLNLGRAAWEAADQTHDPGWAAFFRAMRAAPGDALSDTGSDLGAYWSDLLLDRPEMTNTVVDGIVAAGSLVRRRQLSYQQTISTLVELGGIFGSFDDTRPITIGRSDLTDLRTLDAAMFDNVVVPASLEDLLHNQRSLQAMALPDTEGSRLRIIEVPGAGGSSWIVQIPGTQAWGTSSGGNPSDLTTNLHLSGREDAALLDAIDEALRSHGIGNDPVMLVGHSQGGIAAATFAGQADRRGINVTHVVTAGSPIAHTSVPDDVQVLAMEHANDPVPRLDGTTNRDRWNVTTVVTRLGGSDKMSSAIEPHSASWYAETAHQIDQSRDPSVTGFLESADPFLSGSGLRGQEAVDSGLLHDHVIRRDQP